MCLLLSPIRNAYTYESVFVFKHNIQSFSRWSVFSKPLQIFDNE
jgi:hypothetical protein